MAEITSSSAALLRVLQNNGITQTFKHTTYNIHMVNQCRIIERMLLRDKQFKYFFVKLVNGIEIEIFSSMKGYCFSFLQLTPPKNRHPATNLYILLKLFQSNLVPDLGQATNLFLPQHQQLSSIKCLKLYMQTTRHKTR